MEYEEKNTKKKKICIAVYVMLCYERKTERGGG